MSRPPLNPAKTTAGIAVDPQTLERVIPESRRPDGTVRKQIKIRPGFTPQEDVSRFRGTKQAQLDINTLPKGHIIGWAPPPTSTSTSEFPALPKSAKKNAKRKKAKEIAQQNGKRDEEEVGGVLEKQAKEEEEDVPENWEDDGDESGPQGSNSGTPDTNPSMTTTTTYLKPAMANRQVSPAEVERDLSSDLDKLNVK